MSGGSVYNVGIHLTAVNGISGVLGVIGKDLLGLGKHVDALTGKFSRMHLALGGAAGLTAGLAGLTVLDKIAKHGEKLTHYQSMLLRNGVELKDVTNLTADAFERITKAVPTALASDVLRVANEMKTIKGTLDSAREAIPAALKIEALIGNATHRNAEGQGYDMWRAVEDKGAIQNKELTEKLLDAMTRGTIATGGKITGTDWFQYARRAGSAWGGDAIEAMPLQLMEMQTMGSDAAGVARRSFANMIEGAQKLTKLQVAAWSKAGLWKDDHVVGHEIEQNRPDLFIQKVIDALAKHGIAGEEAVQGWASTALNRKSKDYFFNAYKGMTERGEDGRTRLDKETSNLGQAQGLDKAYGTMMGKDYGANVEALHTAFSKLMEAVGGPVAQAAIPVMQKFASVFGEWSAAASKMPDDIKRMAEAFGLLSAGFVGAGAVALLGAIGPGGWLVLGLSGIAAAMKYFDPESFAAFKSFFGDLPKVLDPQKWRDLGDRFARELKDGLGAVEKAFNAFITYLGSIPGKIMGAIGGAVSGALGHLGLGGSAPAPESSAGAAPTPKQMHFVPVPSQQQRPVLINAQHTIKLDGQTLARATSTHLARLYEHPTSAAYHDGSRGFGSPHMQAVDV